MKLLQSAHRVISALESLSGWVASACLFAIMVIVFFVVGAVILTFVDVDSGRRAARAAEADVAPVG